MRVLNTMCMILRDVLMEYQWCHTASTKVNKLQRNTTKSRQTNSTYTAQRTAAYARVHTDNKSKHSDAVATPQMLSSSRTTKSKSLESKQEMNVAQYGHHVVLDLTISQIV